MNEGGRNKVVNEKQRDKGIKEKNKVRIDKNWRK